MRYFIFIISILSLNVTYGQSPLSNNRDQDFEENFVDPDSVNYDAYTEKTSSFKALFNGKPGRAILYGMLIPGGGQLYNKDYWKVPLAWAAEGTAIGTFIVLRGRFNDIDAVYRARVMGEDAEYRGVSEVGKLFNFREQFQKQSEQAGVAIIIVHVLVAVESYIDRHLSAFDIDEDLSFDSGAPGIGYNSQLSGVTLKYQF